MMGPSKNLNIVSWNIHGNTGQGYAKTRREIVNETLKSMKLDIVCLQENSLLFENFERNISILCKHGYVEVKETGLHNQVLYDKSKFTSSIEEALEPAPEYTPEQTSEHTPEQSSEQTPEQTLQKALKQALKQAYQLMRFEKEIIDWIANGKDDRIMEFTQKKIRTSEVMKGCKISNENALAHHVQAVIDDLHLQIKVYGTDLKQSYYTCKNHFIRYKESETKNAEDLLKERAAMAFLTYKDTSTILLVISFHSYNPNRHSEGLNYLLFDLVEKLFWCTAPIPVLICGDFNENIMESRDDMVKKLISENYTVTEYKLKPLRKGKDRLDNIICRKQPSVSSPQLPVEAVEIVIPENQVQEAKLTDEQRKLTHCKKYLDHSPLVATLSLVTESTS